MYVSVHKTIYLYWWNPIKDFANQLTILLKENETSQAQTVSFLYREGWLKNLWILPNPFKRKSKRHSRSWGQIKHQVWMAFQFSFIGTFGTLWNMNLEGLHGGTFQLDRLNYAQVVLIPKKGETKEVRDFRPSRVLNASVKIISKVLANILRDVLGDFIDDHQSGLLKGRSIVDSITFA